MADAESATDSTAEDAGAEPEVDSQLEVEVDDSDVDWKAESRKHERRAKENAKKARDNAAAAAELTKLREAAMSEQEKAVAAALETGRAEGLKAGSTKLAGAEIRAALAGRSVDADALLEGLDLAHFVDDTGEPDREAILAWVERVAPTPEAPDPMAQAFPDIGQGQRTDAAAAKNSALNGDPLLAALKSKVGAR